MTLMFKDTCFGKARTWLSTLDPYPTVYAPATGMTQVQKDATLKSQFLQRLQLTGRTHDSIFAHFNIIKFDPTKDNIEAFCNGMEKNFSMFKFPRSFMGICNSKSTAPYVGDPSHAYSDL